MPHKSAGAECDYSHLCRGLRGLRQARLANRQVRQRGTRCQHNVDVADPVIAARRLKHVAPKEGTKKATDLVRQRPTAQPIARRATTTCLVFELPARG